MGAPGPVLSPSLPTTARQRVTVAAPAGASARTSAREGGRLPRGRLAARHRLGPDAAALDRTTVFRHGLTSMVEQIQASGARVVVLGAPPDLQSCASGLSQPADCADDLCPAFVDSTPVFADGVHMTAAYSERIGGSVARGATGELTAGPSP